MGGRLGRERRTLEAMIEISCRERHRSGRTLCAECEELRRYAAERLAGCPFGEQKPTCANCAVHCYSRDRREEIRDVMRRAGPRMPLRHPLLSFVHLVLDARRPAFSIADWKRRQRRA
jgi:Nitrous oxide-stimulated promoter